MSKTVQSKFESEVEAYREAMDAPHDTASGQQKSLESLDAAMGGLRRSITQMTDAFDEYDHAITEFDAAVVSLGEHAADQSPSAGRDSAPLQRPLPSPLGEPNQFALSSNEIACLRRSMSASTDHDDAMADLEASTRDLNDQLGSLTEHIEALSERMGAAADGFAAFEQATPERGPAGSARAGAPAPADD
jgi:prefoldin subunit 5